MDAKTLAFWAFAALAVLPGLGIVLARDIVRVAFWLLGSLSGVAGLYVLLGADFLGFTQILVYIGGIMVLLLFGIMMTNKDPIVLKRGESSRAAVAGGFIVGALTLYGLLKLVHETKWHQEALKSAQPTTAWLGDELMTTYVLPFELVSVLLLVVLCGAAYIARRRNEEAVDG